MIVQVQQSKLADINLTCELTGHGLDEQDVWSTALRFLVSADTLIPCHDCVVDGPERGQQVHAIVSPRLRVGQISSTTSAFAHYRRPDLTPREYIYPTML